MARFKLPDGWRSPRTLDDLLDMIDALPELEDRALRRQEWRREWYARMPPQQRAHRLELARGGNGGTAPSGPRNGASSTWN